MTSNNSSTTTITSFIWQVADDILRDIYVKGKYRDVILPMVVLTRIDSELVETKDKTLSEYNKYKDKITNIQPILERCTGYNFFNISPFTLASLLKDPDNIDKNFLVYLNGFSDNIQDILTKFKFYNQIQTLKESQILFALIQKFVNASELLSPKNLNNHDMGYVFEELIRKFNEENNEEAGEHFTPREVIKLMTNLLFLPVVNKVKNVPLSIYDPCVGSGGMLSLSKEFLQSSESKIESTADIFTFGQEINPETYALCKADMLLKGETDNQVAFGSTLSIDGFPTDKFDFVLTNPPYGKSWKTDQDKLSTGGKKIEILDSRFQVGTPRINDGQLLFILHMISKMKHDTPMGTRIASVHNGSALFTGDAGSGESEIRKHLIENDYIEAIVALPKDLFYNTGIGTYIWVMTNRKPEHKKGKIQLINATSSEFYSKMTKSLGNKRQELKQSHIDHIYKIFDSFEDSKHSKIFDNNDFGYTQIIVDRPIRKSVTITEANISDLFRQPYEFNKMSVMKHVFKMMLFDITGTNDEICHVYALKVLECLINKTYHTYENLEVDMIKTYKAIGAYTSGQIKPSKLRKVVESIFEFCGIVNTDGQIIQRSGKLVPNSELRDKENIPLKMNIQEYFDREVVPFAPDAFYTMDTAKVGYEINFNKYFYEYTPPRELADIVKDILALEAETDGVLKGVIKD